ncbi:hypothetical protein AMS62_24630 [Bacillus sp. FJAT-18019]|nr:hypothetical protein AMS62_24630 [Bacillus sp. FJAT-18019]
MNKKTRGVITVCCSLAICGAIWVGINIKQADANSPSLEEKVSLITKIYEVQKRISDALGVTAEDEQKLKELETRDADLEAELNLKSDLEKFNEVFAGYKELFTLESAYYEDHQNLEDPAVQQVLYELEQKGKLIAQYEKSLLKVQSEDPGDESIHGESLLNSFYEETNKLNQELYKERFK